MGHVSFFVEGERQSGGARYSQPFGDGGCVARLWCFLVLHLVLARSNACVAGGHARGVFGTHEQAHRPRMARSAASALRARRQGDLDTRRRCLGKSGPVLRKKCVARARPGRKVLLPVDNERRNNLRKGLLLGVEVGRRWFLQGGARDLRGERGERGGSGEGERGKGKEGERERARARAAAIDPTIKHTKERRPERPELSPPLSTLKYFFL